MKALITILTIYTISLTSCSSNDTSKTVNTVEATNNLQKAITNKEFKNALSINLDLIKSLPSKPYFLAQRGLIHSLLENTDSANYYFDKSYNLYKNIDSPNDTNFQLEYLSNLPLLKNDTNITYQKLKELKQQFPNYELLKFFEEKYANKTRKDIIQEIKQQPITHK